MNKKSKYPRMQIYGLKTHKICNYNSNYKVKNILVLNLNIEICIYHVTIPNAVFDKHIHTNKR